VFTVTRDFVCACQTPPLVLPDDVPAHPYAVAMETARLAPKAEVSLYPWKASKDQIPQAARAEATEAGYAQLIVVRIPASILPLIGQTVSVTRHA
jgi:hypothetical protein